MPVYSDVLLRAAECENEVERTNAQQAINWIDEMQSAVQTLKDLELEDFDTADKLF